MTILEKIVEQLEQLDETKQRQVLELVQELRQPKGVNGKSLLWLVGSVSPQDVEQMEIAMMDFEKIDPNEW